MTTIEPSRRTVLAAAAGVPAAGLLTSLFSTLPATAEEPIDYAALRVRWADIITGRRDIDASDPRFTEALESRQAAAEDARSLLSTADDAVFSDMALDSNWGVLVTFRRLDDMALAWATPGTSLHEDPNLVSEVVSGLRTAETHGYNPGIPHYGNWWTWEIGVPTNLANTMVLVHDHLTADDITNYCAAIDYYVPDPWYSKPEGQGRGLSTGSGRINLCKPVIVRSLCDGDTARLEHARAGLAVAWETVTSGDGFYPDGSYIAHTAIAYTGSYGTEIVTGLAQLFALLESMGTEVPEQAAFFELIDRSFLPIVYRGQVLDSVRGRAITRHELGSRHETGRLLESLVTMSDAVDADTANHWLGRCKSWMDELGDSLPLDSVPRVAALRKLEASSATALPEPEGVHLFGSMDRVVIRQPGWGMSIAGASDRIALYEPGNGENPRGFYTGAGMTTLYNDDIDQYDDNFWPTVDWYRLPGTTSDQLRLPDETGGGWGEALSPGDWTGGSAVHRDSVDSALVFAQDLVGLGDTGLRARKFWLAQGGLIVALGSEIRSTSGSTVETVVENRNLHETGTNRLLVDGQEHVPDLYASHTVHDPGWAHLEGVGGYLFEPGTVLSMRREQRSGAWSDINGGGPTDEIGRRFLTLWMSHGANPDSETYAYVLVPGAAPAATEAEAADPRYEVLANDEQVQAARISPGVRGFAFWKAGSVDDVSTNGPGAVLIKDADDIRTVVVTAHGDGAPLSVLVPAGGWTDVVDDGGAQVSVRRRPIRGSKDPELVFRIHVPRSPSPQEYTVVLERPDPN